MTSSRRRTVLLLQTLEQREPVFDLLEPLGRGVDPGGVRAQEEREVLELRLDDVARLEVRREAAVDRRQICQALPDDRRAPEGRRARPRRAPRRRRRTAAAAGRRWPAPAASPRARRPRRASARRVSISVELERQELGARGVLPRVGEQPFALGVDVAARSRTPRRRTPRSGVELGERVEQVEVGGRVEQDLMLVLAVQVDQDARQIAERGAGGQRAVDEGAAAALRRDLAPEDDFLARPACRRSPRWPPCLRRSGRGRPRRARRPAGRRRRPGWTCPRRSPRSGRSGRARTPARGGR